jgi:hypothetical protein
MDRAALTMATAAMSDPKANATKVAKRLGLTTTTLYVNGDGSPKAAGQAVLDGTHRPGAAAKGRSPPVQGHPPAVAGA